MSIAWSDITVSLDGLTADDLLADWRWLIDFDAQPLVLTAMGDLFLLDSAGAVWWLDVARGRLSPVADSTDRFQEMINEGDNATRWFMPQVVIALGARMTLPAHKVFSLDIPAILGGEYEFGNITPTNAPVHFSIHGQLHRQVKDLPLGTQISSIRVK